MIKNSKTDHQKNISMVFKRLTAIIMFEIFLKKTVTVPKIIQLLELISRISWERF